MCDFGLVLTAASTLVGAAGAKQQADASAEAQNYNAKVQDMNSTLAERRARDALERGRLEEQQKREQVSQIQGKQKAAMAANGVDLTFGSPLDTLVDTATLGELDALTIRKSAAREAYDYKVQAVNSKADASLSRANAKATKTGGYLSAVGTVLTGAAKGYGQAYGQGGSLAYNGSR
jgi:hypothetical protein